MTMRPQSRLALAIASASVTNGATATATAIDCVSASGGRAKHLSLDLVLTTADVVSNKPSVLKLQHSDTTDATNYSDISGTVGGTDWTIPNADTTNPNLYKINLNLQGKKRYIKVLVSPRTTQTVFGVANLHWMDQAATTAARANVLALVEA
jgi:hypothetical protein